MANINLHYCAWLLTRFYKKLGFLGLTGLTIVLVNCLFYVMMVQPLKQQLNMARQQLENIKPREMILSSEQQSTVKDTGHEISEFKQLLPQTKTLHQWLSLIDKTAFKQHLMLNRGDYKFTQTKQGELSRYEIVLPVAGQYVQIRQFIANVLLQLPALALTDVKIKRDNSLSPIVEARLVFVLFLQGESL